MDRKLYDLLDWAQIEALEYSEEDAPQDLLGAHVTPAGILVQAFFPDSVKVTVKTDKKEYPMEPVDEEGFYAVLIPGSSIPQYTLEADMASGEHRSFHDPYNFGPQVPEKILKKFNAGICYDIYEYLGAHERTIDGQSGMLFAVWAPNAVRVSVVGDFNGWDGRLLPMKKRKEYGVFELFVPDLGEDWLYKFEVKAKNGLTFLKSDPYGFASELRPDNASVTVSSAPYEWSDEEWMSARQERMSASLPMSVYQVDLATWKKPDDGREYFTYRELAKELASYVAMMGYTHVELFPVMEHSDDESMGFKTTGYFAPTSRFGTPADFRYFVDYMHRSGIGVILTWVPSHFPRDNHALIGFDGTNLYEHRDPRQSLFTADGGLIYNYGRAEVKNFLIANALFWVKEYHADGLRVDDLARMLYLDYGKGPGQWVPNLYGGNENLDAVEFFKHLDSIFHRETDGAVLIAEDSSQWPMVTMPVEEDGLGFDFKWNKGFKDALIEYMQLDPIFRGPHHQELIFSMVYNYSEQFLLSFGWADMTHGYGSMYAKVPGKKKTKLANLRAAYGYTFLHPGKKLLAMGCDIAQKKGFSPTEGVVWESLDDEENVTFQTYMAALLRFYRENPALWALDSDPEGFEWINNISANENMLVFLRKSAIEEQMLLAVVNFSNLAYKNHKIGVPFAGKFKEVFNSDALAFGGDGNVNPRVKASKEDECDELPNSIRVTVPPMGISIFSCTRVEGTGASASSAAKKKTALKKKAVKAAVKKTAVKKAVKKTGRSLKEELEEKVRTEEHR